MVCCCESCSHYSHYDDRLYDSLSGILQYDMIASYLFVTYVICGSVMIGKLGWGGYYYYVHILISWIDSFFLGYFSWGYASYYTIFLKQIFLGVCESSGRGVVRPGGYIGACARPSASSSDLLKSWGGSVAVAGEARLSCSIVIVYRLLLSMTSVTHALI